jgi:hypothetical protein
VYLNAVWASQQRTITDAPLGASTGLPDQAVVLTQIPVLGRADRGARARRGEGERRVAHPEIGKGNREVLRVLEEGLGREDGQSDVVYGDLRLKRDRQKRVSEVWVRWAERPHLYFSRPEDRHYLIDRATGRVIFGNGQQGKIPPGGLRSWRRPIVPAADRSVTSRRVRSASCSAPCRACKRCSTPAPARAGPTARH